MPELPEVEAMLARIAPLIIGRRLVALELLTAHANKLLHGEITALREGDTLIGVTRYGKVGLLHFHSAMVAVQFGMSGRLVLRQPLERHDHFAFRLSEGCILTYADHRRFGAIHVWRPADILHRSPLAGIGPDALNSTISPTQFPFTKRRIKEVLLDQSVIAGLGNIYTCEVLFRSGIDPRRPCAKLTQNERQLLATEITKILAEAVAVGGSTLNDYRGTEGQAGDYDTKFSVYGREGQRCPDCNCNNSILRVVQAGRSTWLCPTRQT